MSEFETSPPEDTPVSPIASPSSARNESFLTRPLFMGYSLPWLVAIFLLLGLVAWFFFWPTTSSQDASERAFGQDAGLEVVQPPTKAPSPSTPAQLQTGGLSVPATSSTPDASGSLPDDVTSLIREGREFEAANREAINRLSDTVRAQTKALASLQQQIDSVAQDNLRMSKQLTVLSVKPTAGESNHAAVGRKGSRSAIAGMQLESLQDGMAWVSWQGRTWAVQPGDRLGNITVREINVADRTVTTSGGVLR